MTTGALYLIAFADPVMTAGKDSKMTTNTNEVKARDAERAKIAAQLADWAAKGGIPQVVTTCRVSAMAPTQAEANAGTWLDREVTK